MSTIEMVTDVVQHYVEAVNSGDLAAVTALFTTDVELRHPTGRFEGLDAVRGFYDELVLASGTQVSLGRLAIHAGTAFFELDATSPLDPDGNVLAAVDVAEVDQRGLIRRLDVYYR